MLKNNLKKLLLVYIIIIAGILICQLCYRAYTNFQINANHKKVEEILEHRLKFSWEEREAMLKDINALINLYFGKDDPIIKDKIALLSYVNVFRWYRRHSDDKAAIKAYKERLLELVNKYNDLIIE